MIAMCHNRFALALSIVYAYMMCCRFFSSSSWNQARGGGDGGHVEEVIHI